MSSTTQRVEALERMTLDLQAQVVGMRSALHAIVESHPNHAELEQLLNSHKFRLESMLGASIAPDSSVSASLAMLDELLDTLRKRC